LIARARRFVLIAALLSGSAAAFASSPERAAYIGYRTSALVGRGVQISADAIWPVEAVNLPVTLAPTRTVPSTSKHSTQTGIASTYGPGWKGWIAWPRGPGWRLRVCGAGGCVVVVTTDSGPDLAMQRAGRIVDLDVTTFERVAGASWTVGLTKVRVTVLGRVPETARSDPGA
jgi:rare lipoprotein A (peptidoglycan hydrolase)